MSDFKFKLGEIVKIKDDAIFHWHGKRVIIVERMDGISYADYIEGATEPRFENSYQVILKNALEGSCRQ